MAIKLNTIINSLGCSTKTNVHNLDIFIAEIVDFETLNVQGSITHKSLVFMKESELSVPKIAKARNRFELLKNNVLVFNQHSPNLITQIEGLGLSYLAVPGYEENMLLTVIKALITEAFATEDRLIAHSMRLLTLIARTSGMQGVLSALSKQVDGWAVLVDSHGQVLESVGAGRLHLEDAVAVVLNKPVRINYPDLQVHVVGSGRKNRGARLVLASRVESAYRVRSIASHAAALLALMLHTSDPSNIEKFGRELVFDELLKGGETARAILKELRFNENNLAGFVLSAKTKNIDLEQLVSRWFTQGGYTPFYILKSQKVFGFVPKNILKQFRVSARDFVSSDGQTVTLGLGELSSTNKLSTSLEQARQAHIEAVDRDETVLRFKDILSVKKGILVLEKKQSNQLKSILSPLTDSGSNNDRLVETLRVYLRHNGSWSSAAKALEIHRQTLVARIEKIEQMLGMELDQVDNRSILWLALRVIDSSS